MRKGRDLGDEYGWKQVYGDVFCPRVYPTLFTALIGSSYQITVVIFSILGELYTERSSLLSIFIFVYAITSPINGYFGGSLFAQMGVLANGDFADFTQFKSAEDSSYVFRPLSF